MRKTEGVQIIIHEIPYVPQVEPVNTSSKHEKTFEEELRKHLRGQLEKELMRCLK